jgi:serine/threonine protein kinase
MRKNLPDRDFFVNKRLPTREDVQIVEFVASGNDGHLFRGHSELLGRDIACKIIPRSNLLSEGTGGGSWKSEVHKADILRNSTAVKFEDIKEWKDDAAGVDCVVLISEFVEGQDLRKFIAKNPGEITVSFIVQWLSTMLNLFNEMRLRNISHGDFHAGNILVEDRSSYDLVGPRFVFRVTDFGVAEATSERRFKDDYLQLADVLSQLLGSVGYQVLAPKDKFIFNTLRGQFLGRHFQKLLCRIR